MSLKKKMYDHQFFAEQQDGSIKSAQQIVPHVLDLLDVKSVVDIGCGTGGWLSVFKGYGIADIFGVDGDYVDEELLKIPVEQYRGMDLTKTFELDRRFDLVVSLEVAEHLPETSADMFIESLTKLGSVILFSAAVPYQGGKHHINEQWQGYWLDKFNQCGFAAVDCIRSKIWENEDVQWWYAQNIMIYVKLEDLHTYPRLEAEYMKNKGNIVSMIHPRLYMLLAKDYFGNDGYKDGMIIGRHFTSRL
ncbi:class I SAM-dependent methyltransferase [Marinicrinis lubricantis]|uniref:Class I SAM-dependent methyltransferase n=1 Tax=Marinicrinis lubricantis TaxID=2086470 RepID=A0ABW1IVK4_9BACL